jgi:hypothetical protein
MRDKVDVFTYCALMVGGALLVLGSLLSGCGDGLIQLEQLGGPCEADNDCASGWCKTENLGVTFTGGVCTQACETQEDCYYPLGMCLDGEDGNFCMQGCLGPYYEIIYPEEEHGFFNECREEYHCQDVWFGNYVCWPDGPT